MHLKQFCSSVDGNELETLGEDLDSCGLESLVRVVPEINIFASSLFAIFQRR